MPTPSDDDKKITASKKPLFFGGACLTKVEPLNTANGCL
jgi:hypothetical protein